MLLSTDFAKPSVRDHPALHHGALDGWLGHTARNSTERLIEQVSCNVDVGIASWVDFMELVSIGICVAILDDCHLLLIPILYRYLLCKLSLNSFHKDLLFFLLFWSKVSHV